MYTNKLKTLYKCFNKVNLKVTFFLTIIACNLNIYLCIIINCNDSFTEKLFLKCVYLTFLFVVFDHI